MLKQRKDRTTAESLPRSRRGAAMVELAVCLPVLIFVCLASIQVADLIFLRQTLHVAGYEASRAAIRKDSTNGDAYAAAAAILNGRQVDYFTVDFQPADVDAAERGDPITVIVRAPIIANTVLPDVLSTTSGNITVVTNMVKE